LPAITGYDNIFSFSEIRGVAQPGSAPEWGSGGRRFKSDHPDIKFPCRSYGLPWILTVHSLSCYHASMLLSPKLTTYLVWIATILLVLQPVTSLAGEMAEQYRGNCCPGCEDDSDRNADRASEYACSCISCLTFDMALESSPSNHDIQISSTLLYEITFSPQALACTIFHPPIAI
jgi:hypothetical protein